MFIVAGIIPRRFDAPTVGVSSIATYELKKIDSDYVMEE
jgi:restriction endonuclease Mrr